MKLIYNKQLKPLAKNLRKAGNLAEVLLWKELKGKQLGYQFLRQRPIDKYIVDFYCPALNLVIEIDGVSHDN
jgi:very-short-patch-repair endonuclease